MAPETPAGQILVKRQGSGQTSRIEYLRREPSAFPWKKCRFVWGGHVAWVPVVAQAGSGLD